MLTDKKRIFAENIIAGVNKADAAAAAGYSQRTAINKASALLKDADVIEYLEARGYTEPSATCQEPEFIIESDATPTDVLLEIMRHPATTIEQKFKAAKTLLPHVKGNATDAKKRKEEADLIRSIMLKRKAESGLTPEEKIQLAESKYMPLPKPQIKLQ